MARPARARSSSRVLGYSRAGAGALIFSKQTPDLLFGIRRCLWSLGALPQTLVWDRQSGLHAGGGRPTEEFAAFCGALRVDWYFCEPRDPQAKGVVERMQDFLERTFEPGRRFANELDFQLQLDTGSTSARTPRQHKTLRCRPVDRLVEEREVMAPLPPSAPDVDRRWCSGSRRIPTCASTPTTTRWTPSSSAAASRSGSPTASSSRSRWTAASWRAGTTRSFAKHRTITALEHARALKDQRDERRGRSEPDVEVAIARRYDQLIA